MNSDEIWLLNLWSGIFGSVIGAIAATIVALLVVKWTNAHQTRLASKAIEEQQRLAEVQLKEQRRASQEQLEQQRLGLDKQLVEQRAEASRARELAAIGDFLSAITGVVNSADDSDLLDASHEKLESARFRMTFEPGSRPLGEAVEGWVSALTKSVRLSHMVFGAKHVMPLPSDAEMIAIDYVGISAKMIEAASTWPIGDEADQRRVLNVLHGDLLSYMARSRKVWDYITPHFADDESAQP